MTRSWRLAAADGLDHLHQAQADLEVALTGMPVGVQRIRLAALLDTLTDSLLSADVDDLVRELRS